MKKTLLIFSISIAIITLMSAFEIYYTSGCPYHSGSPADGLNCGTCHTGGTITPSVTISSVPSFIFGNKYIPGTTYTISVSGSGYTLYGFDLEILNSQSSIANSVLDFGTINSITPAETVNTPTPGWTYSDIMHTAPKSGSFTVLWTAPASGIGYLYCALLGINNNGSTSGDKSCVTSMTLIPSTTNSVLENSENDKSINLSVFPNPCTEIINLYYNLFEKADVHIELFNLLGAKVLDIKDEKQEKGQQEVHYNIPLNLAKGSYFIKTTIYNHIKMTKIILS